MFDDVSEYDGDDVCPYCGADISDDVFDIDHVCANRDYDWDEEDDVEWDSDWDEVEHDDDDELPF